MASVLASLSAPKATRSVGLRSSFRSGAPVKVRPSLARKARTQAVQTVARATVKTAYICIDCGYIYDGSEGPFERLPSSYRCPVCNAPKRRFKPYEGARGKNDAKSMQSRAKALSRGASAADVGVDKDDKNFLLILAAAGAVALGGLYVALNSQF